ncbi:MAG: hybrid sensor histidine kinase/response regulator [Polyangiaceae bacterium]|nr:hybrid sensor histidine kinase/response regulator [Polyangiaceae bacterium]MCW5791085.1 hybrid sensor histidine kinase/response regulator [Polyangiaceae bacterium]
MPKILHIEDEPANRLLVRKLLVAAGFEVIEAEDGLEGIRKARETRPDLILVDIAIPGMDGYEVTLRLRAEEHLKHTPIVAITAEGNRDTSLAVGATGFLQKPIDARSFARTVTGFLGGHREVGAPEVSGEHLRKESQRIVTHLEEKVAELSRANLKMVELDRARKEFYRNISHELATPMTPIVGYVRMLRDLELGPLTDAQGKALRTIDDCVGRLRAMIDNLLDVTGIETGRLRFSRREYDLTALVHAVIGRYQAAIEAAGQTLVLELPGSKQLGYGDPERLGRAVGQVLDNAVKFTPQGGHIGVRLRPIAGPSDGWVDGDAGEDAGDLRFELCIADTGGGVPEALSARLFEPFFQADGSPTRQFGGTGVGLSITRGIITGHGGEVRVESPPTVRIGGVTFGGSAFYLTWPERVPSSDA